MTKNNPKIILIITFIIAIITYSFWEEIKEKYNFQIFYIGISLAFVGYTYVIWLLTNELKRFDKRCFNFSLFAFVVYNTALNSFVDELFFDPTKLEINEYVGFLVIICTAYYKYFKHAE